MRANKQKSLSSIKALEETVDIDSLADVFAPEPPEEPGAVVESRIFELLKPGQERAIILFKADGLSYKDISRIMGLSETQVRAVVYLVKAKLTKLIESNKKMSKEP